MKTGGRVWLYGFLIWIIGMAVGTALWPIHSSHLPLFKSLMVVTMVAVEMVFILRLFRPVASGFPAVGIRAGAVWTAVNWALDLVVLVGLLKTPLGTYFWDVGLRYLAIPIMTIGCGFLLQGKTKTK